MAKRRQDGLNRREFLSRSGRGAMAGGLLSAASQTPIVMAEAQETKTPERGKSLLVGWSTVSITPDRPVQLHGQFHERVSERVLDPCLATALALEGSGEQAIMVSCDVVNVQREVADEVRKRVSQRLPDFDADKLFLNATHTHTGPTMTRGLYRDPEPPVMGPVEYSEFFTVKVTEAAIEAWNARKPGAVSRALGHAAVGFCRIAKYADGTAQMYGKSARPDFAGLEGGNDHGVEILFFWDDRKNLTGTLVNVACPSQVVEGQCYVSADFWGPAREMLKEIYGKNLFVYAMTSAAGDQSPRDLVRRGRNEPNMRDIPGQQEMARRIVNAVRYAYETNQTEPVSEPIVRHHAEILELPARKVTDEEAAMARQAVAEATKNGDPKPGSREAGLVVRMNRVINLYETQGDSPIYSMNLHVIRLGDAAIATNPFELYIEYGKCIKGRSAAQQTFLAQLTGDRGLYLPTPQALAGGAYGSRITENNVGPEGGEALVERTVEVINSMWKAEGEKV
jgi:hypothetical protein